MNSEARQNRREEITNQIKELGRNGRLNAKTVKDRAKPDTATPLKGWQEIAAFLGEPVSVVQRWAAEGMPVHREGRFVSTSPEDLNEWLGQESGKPVHVVTEKTPIFRPSWKRGLSFIRGGKNLPGEESVLRRSRKRKVMNRYTTCLHVPSIGLIVAGDAAYNGVHLHLSESPDQRGRRC